MYGNLTGIPLALGTMNLQCKCKEKMRIIFKSRCCDLLANFCCSPKVRIFPRPMALVAIRVQIWIPQRGLHRPLDSLDPKHVSAFKVLLDILFQRDLPVSHY